MERFAVAVDGAGANRALVAQELSNAVQPAQKRKRDYAEDLIKLVTEEARQHGASRAHTKHPEVPRCTIENWLRYWRQNKKYFVPKSAPLGRPSYLSTDQRAALLESIEKLGKPENAKSISARSTAAMARGIVCKTSPQILANHGGPRVMDQKWATKLLHREGLSKKARTTTRTVSTEAILSAMGPLFTKLLSVQEKYQVQPEFTVNIDQFFMVLGQNKKWTWARRGEKNVPLKEHRSGLTGCVSICADGELLELLLHWEGTTDRCHAQGDIIHPAIVQDHSDRTDTHFMNHVTWARLIRRLIMVVKQKRLALDMPSANALFIFDDAPQHIFDETLSSELDAALIHRVQLPPNQTHVWQPADQECIAVLRRKVDKKWDDSLEEMWATLDIDDAVKAACTTSTTAWKRRLLYFFGAAAHELAPSVILRSWDTSSLSCALWHQPPRCLTSFQLLCRGHKQQERGLAGAEKDEVRHRAAHDTVLAALAARNAADAGDEDMDDIPVLMAPFVRNT